MRDIPVFLSSPPNAGYVMTPLLPSFTVSQPPTIVVCTHTFGTARLLGTHLARLLRVLPIDARFHRFVARDIHDGAFSRGIAFADLPSTPRSGAGGAGVSIGVFLGRTEFVTLRFVPLSDVLITRKTTYPGASFLCRTDPRPSTAGVRVHAPDTAQLLWT